MPRTTGLTPPHLLAACDPQFIGEGFPYLSYVKQNKRDGSVPPLFRLDLWEELARALSRIPPGATPLRSAHQP